MSIRFTVSEFPFQWGQYDIGLVETFQGRVEEHLRRAEEREEYCDLSEIAVQGALTDWRDVLFNSYIMLIWLFVPKSNVSMLVATKLVSARLFHDLADYDRSSELIRTALDIARRHRLRALEAHCYLSLGRNSLASGGSGAAIFWFREARDLASGPRLVSLKIELLFLEGRALQEIHDYSGAKTCLREGIRLAKRQTSMRSRHLKVGWRASPNWYEIGLRLLGDLYSALGDRSTGNKLYIEAESQWLGKSSQSGESLSAAKSVMLAENYREAIERYQSILATTERLQQWDELIECHLGLAECLSALKHFERSLFHSIEALDHLIQLRTQQIGVIRRSLALVMHSAKELKRPQAVQIANRIHQFLGGAAAQLAEGTMGRQAIIDAFSGDIAALMEMCRDDIEDVFESGPLKVDLRSGKIVLNSVYAGKRLSKNEKLVFRHLRDHLDEVCDRESLARAYGVALPGGEDAKKAVTVMIHRMIKKGIPTNILTSAPGGYRLLQLDIL